MTEISRYSDLKNLLEMWLKEPGIDEKPPTEIIKFAINQIQWIKIEDQKPPFRKWVLLHGTCENSPWLVDSEIFVGRDGKHMKEGEYQCVYGNGYIPKNIKITHWMPLPLSPKE